MVRGLLIKKGFFRPTKNVEIKQNQFEDKPLWKTSKNLHFDMNPWNYISNIKSIGFSAYKSLDSFCSEYNEGGIINENEKRVQGLINLLDNKEEDGGFILVPGYHKKITEWAEKNKKRGGDFIVVSKNDEMYNNSIRITMRRGTLLIWDNRMPHGSQPNNSSNPRMAQFIKMFPKKNFTIKEERSNLLMKVMKINNYKPSKPELFGFTKE
jgi:hypothetical protein